MVSLNGSTRQSGQGGITFFSESLSSNHDDEPLLDASMPVLPHNDAVGCWMTQEIRKFRTIRTVGAILLAMFLYTFLIISAILLPMYCGRGKCGVQQGTTLVLYVHAGLWFLLVLIHMYLMKEHHTSLLHGYFVFHLETHTLKRLPLLLNSAGNAVCVVVVQMVAGLCRSGEDRCGTVPKEAYLQMLISLEGAMALIILLVYLVKTLRFNRAKGVPDFLRLSSVQDSDPVQHQIGFRRKHCSYKRQQRMTMTLMWYEVLFWKQKRMDLCCDILELQERLEEMGQ